MLMVISVIVLIVGILISATSNTKPNQTAGHDGGGIGCIMIIIAIILIILILTEVF